MKRYALLGAAGYIAPRHMKAIRDLNGDLVACLDKSDSVGILDSFFPDCHFFTEFERFDRHIDLLRRKGKPVDYISICTPNYLHDSHIRFALRQGMDAICEKPLVLNEWNIDALSDLESETGKRVYSILQLRLHPAVVALRERVIKSPVEKVFNVNLNYISSRGRWYLISWKGDEAKSGGICTNIGVHFFDMLMWIFGKVKSFEVQLMQPTRCTGFLELEKARVQWHLSVEYTDLPEKARREGKRTYRSLTIENDELEFSDGFTELHTRTYESILSGSGFGLDDVRPSIALVQALRTARPTTG